MQKVNLSIVPGNGLVKNKVANIKNEKKTKEILNNKMIILYKLKVKY